ncbi:MAG: hypothetical protein WCL16_07050 [bacterium]
MKKFMALIACSMLVGCDYTVPLVKTPALEIDPGIVGLWQRSKTDGQAESLLVLPLGRLEYMLSFPAGSKDAMFARACLVRIGKQTLVQLEWLGTAQGKVPEDTRVFQFAAYALAGDTISISMLNTGIVKNEATSTAALTKSIADNQGNPDLFKEKMIFKKVAVAKDP